MKRYASLAILALVSLAFLPDHPAKAGVGERPVNRFVCSYRGKKGFSYPGYGMTRAEAMTAASDRCISAADTPCYFESCSSAR